VQEIYEKALRDFLNRVTKGLGEGINSIVLYGSVARKEVTKGSDIDILIISKMKEKIAEKASDMSYDVDLKYTTATSLVYLTPKEIEHRIRVGSPFIESILKEGRVLYDDGTFKRIREKVFRARK